MLTPPVPAPSLFGLQPIGALARRRLLGRPGSLDYFALVRLVGKNVEPLVDRMLFADEALVLVHDLAHGGFDRWRGRLR